MSTNNNANRLSKNLIVSPTFLGFLRTVHLHRLVKGFGQQDRNDEDCMCHLIAFFFPKSKP